MTKERRLGRGLAALLGEDAEPVSLSETRAHQAAREAQQADRDPVTTLRVHHPDDVEVYDEFSEDKAGSPAAVDQGGAQPSLSEPNADATQPPSNQRNDRTAHPQPVNPMSEAQSAKDGDLLLLSVYEIEDNPFQPRREFNEDEISSLAESLKVHDMLQPVLVRRVGERWQLISGERRLRAAIKAGWTQIPARVRQADDRLVAELAIVENLQRKDLNAIEKALSFRRYLEQHQCTQDDLAERLKLDRSTIANMLRLLELPERVQEHVQSGAISMGHARAILPLGDESIQREFSRRIQADGWSVREAERRVSEYIAEEDLPTSNRGRKRRKPMNRSSQVASLEEKFRVALGTKVDLKQNTAGKGQIVIHFKNGAEFERIMDLMMSEVAEQMRTA